MSSIKDELIGKYPLTKKIEGSFDCFEVSKRRYVIFFDRKIKKDNNLVQKPKDAPKPSGWDKLKNFFRERF